MTVVLVKLNTKLFTFNGSPIEGLLFDPNSDDQNRTGLLTSSAGGDVNSLDENFGLPSSWRTALAFDFDLVDGWFVGMEFNRDRVNKAFAYVDPFLKEMLLEHFWKNFTTTIVSDLHTTTTDLGFTNSVSYKVSKSFLDDKLRLTSHTQILSLKTYSQLVHQHKVPTMVSMQHVITLSHLTYVLNLHYGEQAREWLQHLTIQPIGLEQITQQGSI